MKQFLFFIGLTFLFSGIFSSCKPSTLDTLREDELIALDKYVKENNLTDTKDVSGIYFKDIEKGTGDTIKSGYKVMLYYNITTIGGVVVFSTEDAFGHNYEERAFYVDVNNTIVNESYVQQIAGLHKGLKKMQVGGKALIVIPSELAFKAVDNSATIGIPRFTTLVATVFAKKAYSPEQQK